MSAQDVLSGENKPDGLSLSKYIRRMKTVLRRSSSKRASMASGVSGAGRPSRAVPATTSPAPPKPITAAVAPSMMTNYGTMQHEKARALFAKYGLTLEPGEWKSPPAEMPLQRVTKPIRMRVRRTCHRCETTFGPEKVCVHCQHPRCKKCPRFPPAYPAWSSPLLPKPKFAEIISRQRLSQPIPPHIRVTGDPHAPLIKSSHSTVGQEVVHKPVRQRVRRTCHECGTLFSKRSRECESCSHIQCKKCPRDPAKLHKNLDGYPGDVDPPRAIPNRTWKKPRRRYRWICHVCSSTYREGASSCWKCAQGKCAETIRDPPKKVKQEFDPEVVRRVEEKLAALSSPE